MAIIISIIALVAALLTLILHESRFHADESIVDNAWKKHKERHEREQKQTVSLKTHGDDYQRLSNRLDDLNARTSALQDVTNTLIKQSNGFRVRIEAQADVNLRHGEKINTLWEKHLSKQNQKRDGRGRYAKAEPVW